MKPVEFVEIAAGAFLIGTPERELSALAKAYGGTRESYREESPQCQLSLERFWIARTPVTNQLYAAYVAETGAAAPLHWRGTQPPLELAEHPVVDINWTDAVAYCAWLQARLEAGSITAEGLAWQSGMRVTLPSEAQWERAARGVDGRVFPWGDTWDGSRANTRESGLGATQPVGSYSSGASPAGCLDMAGTVWEWTSSLDRLYPYDPHDGREDQHAGGRRILRGGCYANPHGYARCACRFRLLPTVRNEFLGFRLAIV
ncbi:MAG TPA: formylglycine-generating enzyme family protein [Roseiflexaceae bacterium]|nr:formylglycine-generating enzyme family protein [Roseiflexaceae bacterium]